MPRCALRVLLWLPKSSVEQPNRVFRKKYYIETALSAMWHDLNSLLPSFAEPPMELCITVEKTKPQKERRC